MKDRFISKIPRRINVLQSIPKVWYDVIIDYADAKNIKESYKIFQNPYTEEELWRSNKPGDAEGRQISIDSLSISLSFEQKKKQMSYLELFISAMLFLISVFWAPVTFLSQKPKETFEDRVSRLKRMFFSQAFVWISTQATGDLTIPTSVGVGSAKHSQGSDFKYPFDEPFVIYGDEIDAYIKLTPRLVRELNKNDDLMVFVSIHIEGVVGRDAVNG